MSGRLFGRVALVTGTSPNIGGGIAEGLAAEGAAVVCVDSDPANAQDCAVAIRAAGGRAEPAPCDVTDAAQVEAAVARAQRCFGPVDVLVNNAVQFNQKGVLDMALAEWRRQIDIILTGAFLTTGAVARALIAAGRPGAIVNIISTAGHQGQPRNVGYCTGKSGLLNFTRSVAMELAPHRIRVNSVTPTATDPREALERAQRWGRAPAESAQATIAFFESFRRGTPLQELPRPTDYAQAVAFLASDEARMITGTDLRVDSGAVARYWAWSPPGS